MCAHLLCVGGDEPLTSRHGPALGRGSPPRPVILTVWPADSGVGRSSSLVVLFMRDSTFIKGMRCGTSSGPGTAVWSPDPTFEFCSSSSKETSGAASTSAGSTSATEFHVSPLASLLAASRI